MKNTCYTVIGIHVEALFMSRVHENVAHDIHLHVNCLGDTMIDLGLSQYSWQILFLRLHFGIAWYPARRKSAWYTPMRFRLIKNGVAHVYDVYTV